MNALSLILGAILLLAVSGVPGSLLSPRSRVGQRLATLLMVAGSLFGLAGVAVALRAESVPAWSFAWSFASSRFAVAADPVSCLFLVPVFLVPMLGSFYGLSYWPAAEHPANARRLGLVYGLLAGAMALVVVARDGMLFLIAWEVMALAAYFAATAEDEKREVRDAGWVYLVATHVGTLCLLAMFALWRSASGSFALERLSALPPATASALFLLALVGFGFKAGLMPLHVWLPGAHANAPSHLSAVMSGVMLKMGVYGLVRMTALLPPGETWWGASLLVAGAVSSVVGIAYAVGQRDLKRVLAYSSIENVGIIAMGLGLAVLGRTHGRFEWQLLGLGGALLHVWNHALFKSLLFLNSGAIIHATHTRDIEKMGGLAKRAPRTMLLFAVGAIAICALPPLNGFVSEWLLYIGFFRALAADVPANLPVVAVAAVALAATGALAVACFVRLISAVFLGEPRGDGSSHAHDPAPTMLAPMVALAVGCLFVGLLPGAAVAMVEAAVAAWTAQASPTSLAAVVPFHAVTVVGLSFLVLVALLAVTLLRGARKEGVRRGVTWDCGYAQPTARMQYTASSFGDSLVRLTSFLLWPRRAWPRLRSLFPAESAFTSEVPDTVLDRLVAPLFTVLGKHLPWLRILQQGRINVYLSYILIIVIALLLWGGVGS